MAVTNVGRISGPLLKANLTRTSDLAFETNLLYIDVINNRIGVKNDAPTREFLVSGDAIYRGNLIATNSASIGNINIDGPTDTFSTLTGPINMVATTNFQMTELRTGNLAFTNSGIRAYNGGDIRIEPGPGAGGGVADAEYNNGTIINVTGDGSDFFKREVTVNGVRVMGAGTVGGQTAVPDAWLEKVARMFELFTDSTGAGINQSYQRALIKTLSGDTGTYHAGQPTIQRVARGAGADYTPNFLTDAGVISWNLTNLFDTHVQNDMVWYLNSTGDGYGDGDIDAQEVIEHVFHTLHMHGLPADDIKLYQFLAADWQTGDLYAAMEEAYDAGKWDPSGYQVNPDDWKTDADAFEVAAKEYLYLLNFAMFEYTELWDGGSLAPEWTDDMRTQAGIQTNNPLGYAFHNTYIAPVISKPSLATIRSIFQDGNTPAQDDPSLAGASGYVPTSVGGATTGKVIIPSDLNTTGNIHATGDISFDGNIFIGGDGPEDTLSFNGDIESDLIPDVTSTYDIGSDGQRWGDMHVQTMTGLNDITIDNTISLSGVAVNLGIANKWYVSTNGTDQLAGNHPNFAFGTIRHALSYIEESTAGPHELHILPGTYTEQFPLEVPANVTVKGAGIRSVTIKPDVPNRYQDAFLMNDASVVTDLTVKDFHYDANTDRGYGFRFSDNAGIVTKSPYVQNVSVVTQGDTRTATDPRGFDSGDAGRGALVDSDVLDTASPRTSMLFNMVTFITPGADAVTVKNGSKIEFINCFTYFANRGLYLQHTLNQYTPTAGSYNPATGVMTLTIGNHAIRVNETITIADNSLTFTCAMDGHATDHTYPRPSDPYSGKKITITETTATSITCNVGISSNVTAHLFKSATANAVTEGTMTEARVIASATIYGNQGVVADGNGSLAYLISHNFAYVGSGKNVENDVDTIDQTNEVVTTNNARVHFVSQDQGGDFRVGDNFIVDLGKGTTSIAVNDGELGASTLTVGVQGKETLVDATKIDVPNFRISNNTIQTLNNSFSIGAVGSSNAVNLTANVLMPKVDITGNATIGGSGLNFGNDAGDTVNFAMDFEQDLLPSQDTQSNIGSATKNWKETNSSRITLDNIDIHNNTIQTTDTNSQLELRASGIGKVNLGTVGFKTNITSASGDVAFSGGTTNTIINSTSHLSLPSGTSAQNPNQGNAVRFDSSINEFELFSTGKIALNGIKDGDRDTNIDLSSNKFTFYTANGYAGEIDGAGNLIVPSFASQDQVAINGNTIGVGSASNPQAGFTANGTGKVVLDTANLEISGATIENKLVNQDITFTGTGLKQNRTISFDSTNGYIGPFGTTVQRDAITARLGAIWWNSDSGLLEVYAGAVDGWVSSIGVQSVTVTDEIAAELNVVYNLILN